MKGLVILAVLAGVALTGCQRKADAPSSSPFGSTARGRYLGVAVYAPGRMWEQIVRAAAPAGAAATLKDDEQVVVVVDSATGELRQCGNLSGFCIAMNPWSNPAAPAALLKHAQQLDDEASSEAGPASPPAP